MHDLNSIGVTLVYADASRLESYSPALVDVDIAVGCMASSNVRTSANDDFWAIDRDANIRFCLEALSSGAKHVILIATFEGRDSRRYTEFSDAKEQAVDKVGEACRQADIPFTVIRPTAYFSDLTNRAFHSVLKTGLHTVIGEGRHRINPIAGEDAAAFIADCIEGSETAGMEYPIGGPDIFTFREIGLLAAEVIGVSKPVVIKTVLLQRLQIIAGLASAAGLVSRKARRSSALIRWMIYSGSHDAVAPAFGERRLRDDFLAKLPPRKSNG